MKNTLPVNPFATRRSAPPQWWPFFLFVLLTLLAGRANAQTACAPAWSAAAVYTQGSQVSRNGTNYEAKWWTQGDDPTTQSCQYCVWKVVAPCGTPGTGNTPPTVELTAPAGGATYAAPATLTLSANATDNVAVAKVEFFSNGAKLGEAAAAPYSFRWTNVAAGAYSLTAKATDNAGLSTTSAAVSVTVTAAPPQAGAAIPGKVEAESYAAMQGVQTEPTTDTGGGRNVSYFDTGDWFDFDAQVATAGSYKVDFRVASAVGSAKLQLHDGAGTVLGTISVGNTGGWQNWQTISTTVTLPAGAQRLRVFALASTGCNVNWLTFTAGTTSPPPPPPTTTGLPKRIMSGYWHNFGGGVPFIRLRDVHPDWDVINISFAEPVAAGSTDGRMKFVLGGPADYTPADFKADVQLLQSRGKKVVLSIGGYEGYFSLGSTAAVAQFVGDIKGFVNTYGFDGIDIDLEQSSVQFVSGADPDFKNPTSPKVVNMISAIRQIVSAYPAASFILSWAPETFYFPMAHQWYGGINSFVDARSGVYLPMIHALRDRTTYVQTQLYNSAAMQGNDGVLYSMGTTEGIVAMTSMVMEGFTVAGSQGGFFPGLRPDQVVIGVPSSQGAAGSGQIADAGLQAAFRQVDGKFPGLRGIMAWSINWDSFQNSNSFVINNAAFLKAQPAAAARASSAQLADAPAPAAAALSVFPNPAPAGTSVIIDLGAAAQRADVTLTDLTGRTVGTYSFRGVRQAEVPLPAQAKGIYLLRIVADGHSSVRKVLTR